MSASRSPVKITCSKLTSTLILDLWLINVLIDRNLFV